MCSVSVLCGGLSSLLSSENSQVWGAFWGAFRSAPTPALDCILGDELMEDRAHKPDAIDRADLAFSNPPRLRKRLAKLLYGRGKRD